ncbi:ATP-dependent DNA ligase, partial [Candidatus Bathyarchaeota archaeon]|nr:ATP-dependent DNA ligase [Candidatus Bathyarchaeota archaeon]
KYLTRILLKEMRTGFHEGLMEQAVAKAFNIPLETVQTASMLTGDIGRVATLAKLEGKTGLLRVKFKIFRPIKPMLAQMITTVAEVLTEHGGQTALEYKLDGARVQIHKSRDAVKIFSRRLTDVTRSLPEIVQQVRSSVKAEKAILEGEIIAVGKDGNPMPFQHLMRRFTRIREIQHALKEVPIQLHLFDALYIDGESLINEPYDLRRQGLATVAGNIHLTKQVVASDAETAEHFMKEAIEAGHEGLMAKKLDSPYTSGIRGKAWLKIKETLEPLDLVIVAAEYGYGRRHGWLSDYCLAARDTESGDLLQVGKTFKGLTDAEIIKMTEALEKSAIDKEGHRVIVSPEVIVEVTYNEIQKSSIYKCGMALRFARISRIRNDKNLEAVDSIQKIRKIYEEQFEKKAKFISS